MFSKEKLCMLRSRHSWVLRYSISVFASSIAVILTQTLWQSIQPALYPFFLAAVMVSSWCGGLGPGLVSTLLAIVFSEYFFLTPIVTVGVGWEELGRISYFTSVASLICVLNARLHHTQRRAETHALEAQRNQVLLLQNQETLQQSEERYRLLVDGVTDYAIFMLTAEGYILNWTIGAERLLGYQEPEIVGQPFSVLFSEADIQQGLPAKVLEIAATQGAAKENRWHIRKDKTLFWAHCVVSALRDEAGNLKGFSKIMQDITARKRAEEERNHLLEREQLARQEAESANRAKDEFLAILSHELRTPLTAITGWIGMLRSGRLDQARTDTALETIDRNATLQLQLVEDLLDISRIIRGDLWLDSQPVDLVAVIQELIAVVQPEIEAKRLHFTFAVDLSDSTSSKQSHLNKLDTALVLGDSERLQQVILNLLSNAIKFTPAAGALTVRVSLVDRFANGVAAQSMTNHAANHSVSDRSHAVQIQVQDTGIGIKAEFLPHVFDRFRQADSTNTRAYKGLGLGLAIARYLVEQQGGTIQASSLGAGQGATFTVQLPLLTSSDRSHAAHQRFDRSPALTLNGVSILVVEDDADTRNWLVHVLEMQQAQVIAVASVDDALAQLAHWLPDVIVSDIAMPGKDGYALMNALKHREMLADRVMLAIALTAYASPADIEKALTAGFHQHLAKPIKAEALITAIVRLLEQHSSD